jgi:hypothetical protein
MRSGHNFLTLLGIALDYYMLTAKRPFLITGLISLAVLSAGAVMLLVGPRLTGIVIADSARLAAWARSSASMPSASISSGRGFPSTSSAMPVTTAALSDLPATRRPADDGVRPRSVSDGSSSPGQRNDRPANQSSTPRAASPPR